MWAKAPKEKNLSPIITQITAMSAIIQFNEGYVGSQKFYEAMKIPTGEEQQRRAMERDLKRVRKAEYQQMKATKERRTKISQSKSRVEAQLDAIEGVSYASAAFND